MLRAVIFDFDGVVADSEPVHLAAFQRVLGELGYVLSREDYYTDYLGYDDHGSFTAFFTTHDIPASKELIHDLMARKARTYLKHIKQHMVIFPGVQELVREAASRYRLAIASGALRHEIELILEHAGIRKEFAHISSSEDTMRGKPNPEIFLHALDGLNRLGKPGEGPIRPEDCLVIEDSLPGIRGAHAAGMKVLAVANTHTIQDLDEADAVTHSLADVNLSELASRLDRVAPPRKKT